MPQEMFSWIKTFKVVSTLLFLVTASSGLAQEPAFVTGWPTPPNHFSQFRDRSRVYLRLQNMAGVEKKLNAMMCSRFYLVPWTEADPCQMQMVETAESVRVYRALGEILQAYKARPRSRGEKMEYEAKINALVEQSAIVSEGIYKYCEYMAQEVQKNLELEIEMQYAADWQKKLELQTKNQAQMAADLYIFGIPGSIGMDVGQAHFNARLRQLDREVFGRESLVNAVRVYPHGYVTPLETQCDQAPKQ